MAKADSNPKPKSSARSASSPDKSTPRSADTPKPEAKTKAKARDKVKVKVKAMATELPTADGCFRDLLESLYRYSPGFDEPRVEKAYKFAAKYHEGQTRKSGEAYITHPLTVATIASTLKLDLNSIIAAILHDTVEDTECTLADIDEAFGSEVTLLVDGLTKISKIKFRSKQEKLAENFRKMIIAMSRDLRVILIKLCDRLHNMRTINDLADEKRRRISQETLDIYAPLANRLGVYSIKSELEDLCLRYLKPEVYKGLREKVAQKKSQRQTYIDEVIEILERELRKYGFKNMAVTGRPKHFYSIYKKMVSRTLNFEDIHDLFAFRIIVDTIKDCYEALGVVHAMWKPMPGRFKDYIAIPKPNMYQSLHTTVMRPNGETAEIQIRTREMHQTCEFGVAAHWLYKDGSQKEEGTNRAATDVDKFSWLRQIMQWQSELSDPNEFLEAVKVDLFDEEIFVFTPKGDVFTLPMRSTALDYAFNVHSDVGLRTVGAKVNGSMVPIKKTLRSGDMVEILTSPHQTPNKDWLSFVVTSKARNRIRSFLRQEERQHAKTLGENLLQQEVNKLGQKLDFGDKKLRSKLVKIAKESNFDDTLIAVGFGRFNAHDLLTRAFPDWKKATEPEKGKKAVTTTEGKETTSSGVLVSGISDVLVRMGKCCHPVPGEEICGYITRGRQISVHRTDCPRALDLDPMRQIDVSWPKTTSDKVFHRCNLQVITYDGTGILADVTQTISKSGANVYKAEAGTRANLTGILEFELGVKNVGQLDQIISQLEKIPSVIRVTRNSAVKPSRKVRKKRRRL